MAEKEFLCCEKCGKRLIVRLPNGIGQFKFGKQYREGRNPVEITIIGMIRINCLNRECNHEMVLGFFPTSISPIEGFQSQTSELSGKNNFKSKLVSKEV